MTRKEYFDWLARLRDPASGQARGGLVFATGRRCAIGHLYPELDDELHVQMAVMEDHWLSAAAPSLGSRREWIVRMNDNDNERLTLPEIADQIEKFGRPPT